MNVNHSTSNQPLLRDDKVYNDSQERPVGIATHNRQSDKLCHRPQNRFHKNSNHDT